MTDEYEFEHTVPRDEAATVLHEVADAIAAGSVRVGEGEEERTVGVPGEVELEVEFESQDGRQELEVELEWPEEQADAGTGEDTAGAAGDAPSASGDESTGEPGPDEADQAPTRADAEADESAGGVDDPVVEEAPGDVAVPAVGAAAQQVSLGRFELFEDRGGEWRWRLVHRNGNVIATSGEGYTRKHNARKGLRSVMRNAEGAEVTERTEE